MLFYKLKLSDFLLVVLGIILPFAICLQLIFDNLKGHTILSVQIPLLSVAALLTAKTYFKLYGETFEYVVDESIHQGLIIVNFISLIWDFLFIGGFIFGGMNYYITPFAFIGLAIYTIIWTGLNTALFFGSPVLAPSEEL